MLLKKNENYENYVRLEHNCMIAIIQVTSHKIYWTHLQKENFKEQDTSAYSLSCLSYLDIYDIHIRFRWSDSTFILQGKIINKLLCKKVSETDFWLR